MYALAVGLILSSSLNILLPMKCQPCHKAVRPFQPHVPQAGWWTRIDPYEPQLVYTLAIQICRYKGDDESLRIVFHLYLIILALSGIQ